MNTTAIAEAQDTCRRILDAVATVVVGKRPALDLVMSGLLTGGHVLLEDVPGVGRARAAKWGAQILKLVR